MRLRPLSEAECYARCYGGRSEERLTFLKGEPEPQPRRGEVGDELRDFFDTWLASPKPEHDREAV